MTSDAKIGLLLGLVFIFIIAFIINGLPSLRPEPNGNEFTMEMTQFGDQPQGAGATEQSAFEELRDEPALPAEPIDESPGAFAVDHGSLFGPEIGLESGSGSLGFGSGQFEPVAPLSPVDLTLANRSRPPIDYTGVGVADAAGPAERTIIQLPPGQVDIEQDLAAARRSMAELIEDVTPGEPVVVRPAAPGPIATHQVVSGETLGSIAKKYYGPEEGNRIVNVERIYEANKGTLKSKNDLAVGQKLVIPALPGGVSPADGSGTPAKPKPTLSPGQKWYVVKEGDSLWKIASQELGKGSRSEEIKKLNPDIITNENVVAIGMKLRLPME